MLKNWHEDTRLFSLWTFIHTLVPSAYKPVPEQTAEKPTNNHTQNYHYMHGDLLLSTVCSMAGPA